MRGRRTTFKRNPMIRLPICLLSSSRLRALHTGRLEHYFIPPSPPLLLLLPACSSLEVVMHDLAEVHVSIDDNRITCLHLLMTASHDVM